MSTHRKRRTRRGVAPPPALPLVGAAGEVLRRIEALSLAEARALFRVLWQVPGIAKRAGYEVSPFALSRRFALCYESVCARLSRRPHKLAARNREIVKRKTRGEKVCTIARDLKMTEGAVRKVLSRALYKGRA
jgi:hypothetical protein